MSWIDLVVLAILLLSALFGLRRGFVREALGLCAWVGAAILATRLYGQLLPFARRTINDDAVADPVAFAVVFTVLLIAFLLIAGALGTLVRGSLLGGVDRLAGFAFGLLRGFAVLVIAFLLVAPLLPVSDWPRAVRDSRSLPFVGRGAVFVAARLPSRFRPDLGPPVVSSGGMPTVVGPGSDPASDSPPDHAI